MRTIRKLSISGLLSFAPDSSPFDLQALNVLIGPNGSGKSNFIEVLELLSAAPYNLADWQAVEVPAQVCTGTEPP